MKLNYFLFLAITILSSSSLLKAQDPKHTIYYKSVESVDVGKFIISFDNVVAKTAFTKLGIKIQNLSSDYLLIKKEKTTFTIAKQDFHPQKDWYFIKPNSDESKTFQVEGETNYHVENFTLKVDGIYTVPAAGKIHKAPNFKLPVTQEEFSFGDYRVVLKRLKKKTKETQAIFEIFYNGEDVGIVDPSKISVIVPDKGAGEFNNNDKNPKVKLFSKGDSKTIEVIFNIPSSYIDMQYANMEIVWKDVFQSSKATLAKSSTIKFEIDPGLTEGKNR